MKIKKRNIAIVYGVLVFIFLCLNFIYLRPKAQTKKMESQQRDSLLHLPNQVVCTILPEKIVHRIGQRPSIMVSIQNNTDSTIALTGSLDGSSVKFRFPFCYFEITRNGFTYSPRINIGCAVTNALRAEDYVLLKPGERFNPYTQIDDYGFAGNPLLDAKNYLIPGIYTLQFFYTNYADSMTQEEFYTPIPIDTSYSVEDQQEIKKLQEWRKKEPMIRIKSNKVTLVYRVI